MAADGNHELCWWDCLTRRVSDVRSSLVGAYDDLDRETVEAVLVPGRPLTLQQIVKLAAPQRFLQGGWPGVPPLEMIALVLEANPERFVEVTPGTWALRSAGRGDGPEAGVPSKPPRPLLAGGAAAAAILPEKLCSLDAVSRVGGHVAVEEEMTRQRRLPGQTQPDREQHGRRLLLRAAADHADDTHSDPMTSTTLPSTLPMSPTTS